jgi:capsular exopolysaccharide synthesis family protein
MLGFLAGFGLAILVDQSELSFRSPHEIAEKLNIPVVGRIPRINVRKIKPVKGVPSLIVAHKPGSTASEAFRDVRTAMFFQANQDDLKTILFTSPSPGDGKSTTTANLAISIAQAGKKVILIDADFRRPRVHNYFDEDIKPGLLDVLTGEESLSDAIQKTPLQENLFLLTAGGRPKNPGELVTSAAFRDLIAVLREKFDYVLIDSPPVLPVSDPASIASVVDGVYMVTRIRKGVKVTSQRAKETLDRVGTRFLGIIINGIDENPHYSEYGYQYGAYSYYGGRYGRYYEANYKEYRDKIAK